MASEIFSGPMDFKEILSDNISNEKAKQRIYRHSRPKFHRMLYEQLGQIGLKVEFDKDVVEYFEDEDRGRAGVILKDGSRLEADLVVAADGVRGKSWSLVAGHPVPARSSGDAVFRVAFPAEHVLSDPDIVQRFPFDEKTGRSIIHLIFGSVFRSTCDQYLS
jgi:2-polyprenyl-6-methoxyphenol hydroxylase-like FAD-dependent oxidoreductase